MMKPKPQFQNLRSSGHPLDFNLDDALDKVVRVFSERGYHATVIAELSDVMGISVANIYKAFTDKRGLFLAALDHQNGQYEGQLEQLLAREPSARERIMAVLSLEADRSCGDADGRGPLITGAALELAAFDQETATRLAAVFQRREQLLAGLIQQGQLDGSLPASLDGPALTRFLLCLIQGVGVVGRAAPERAAMQAAVDVVKALLG